MQGVCKIFFWHQKPSVKYLSTLKDKSLQLKTFSLGKHSQHGSQTSDTYNLVFGGIRMSYLRKIVNGIEYIVYQEDSLDVDSEKPLFLQPGRIIIINKYCFATLLSTTNCKK